MQTKITKYMRLLLTFTVVGVVFLVSACSSKPGMLSVDDDNSLFPKKTIASFKDDAIEDVGDLKVAVLVLPDTTKDYPGTVDNKYALPDLKPIDGGLNLRNTPLAAGKSNYNKTNKASKPLYSNPKIIQTVNAKSLADQTGYQDSNVSKEISDTHKDIINTLITTKNSTIIYVFYNNISSSTTDVAISQQLRINTYISIIEKDIYSSKKSNFFIQKVQYKDLPYNKLLIVTKPISDKIFAELPKQVNMYNSPNIKGDQWFATVNRLEKEKTLKLQNLYKQNQ
ncbi:hypothetical protein ACFX5K_02185 [Rickettsiales bacterium LUAb2]